jgi:hypothetical protein
MIRIKYLPSPIIKTKTYELGPTMENHNVLIRPNYSDNKTCNLQVLIHLIILKIK